MRKINLTVLLCVLTFNLGCNSDNIVESGKITFLFTHHWDNQIVTQSDFNDLTFENEKGNLLSIEKLKYLISDITFHKSNGDLIVLEGYQLVDLTKPESLSFQTLVEIPFEQYSDISITFGFDKEDNIDGAYLDLNAASWNVPGMLGGGYHYMQFEGKFLDNSTVSTGYQYHAIRAADISGDVPVLTETYIETNLGSINISRNTMIEVKMNISQWFKNPNSWDLNELHSMMMPNYDAQIMIHENGENVFSLGD